MTQLHLEVRKRIEMLFPREEWDEVVTILLEDVGAIMRDQGQSHERIQMAVLKLSDGDREELKRVVKIDLASDWRDILLFAGFAHDIDEHWRWNPLGPGLATEHSWD